MALMLPSGARERFVSVLRQFRSVALGSLGAAGWLLATMTGHGQAAPPTWQALASSPSASHTGGAVVLTTNLTVLFIGGNATPSNGSTPSKVVDQFTIANGTFS